MEMTNIDLLILMGVSGLFTLGCFTAYEYLIDLCKGLTSGKK